VYQVNAGENLHHTAEYCRQWLHLVLYVELLHAYHKQVVCCRNLWSKCEDVDRERLEGTYSNSILSRVPACVQDLLVKIYGIQVHSFFLDPVILQSTLATAKLL
jgi:hypothetical protein